MWSGSSVSARQIWWKMQFHLPSRTWGQTQQPPWPHHYRQSAMSQCAIAADYGTMAVTCRCAAAAAETNAGQEQESLSRAGDGGSLFSGKHSVCARNSAAGCAGIVLEICLDGEGWQGPVACCYNCLVLERVERTLTGRQWPNVYDLCHHDTFLHVAPVKNTRTCENSTWNTLIC